MDALKAQIASQKRKIAHEQNARTKYMRRGDKEAINAQEHEEKSHESHIYGLPTSETSISPSPSRALPAKEDNGSKTPEDKTEQEPFKIFSDEDIVRLRQYSEPIRLFGESDEDRHLRLQMLQSAEHAKIQSTSDDQQQTPQHDGKDKTAEKPVSSAQESDTPDRVPARMREGVGMHSVMDLKLMWTDTARVYPIIYYTLKGLLEDWEAELEKRPDIVKRSDKGQKMTDLHGQTATNLKPLFKLLRRRSVDSDVLLHIAEIVHYMQQREYRKANDAYLQLSIGNAPWPIGITMAGCVCSLLTCQHPRTIG